MAGIDQSSIALNSCVQVVTSVTQICDALDKIEAIQEELSGADIDLADFSAQIEASGATKHCDAATFKNIIADFAPQIYVALKAYYSGTPTQQGFAAFQKARTLS
jgi:hypothetical protein